MTKHRTLRLAAALIALALFRAPAAPLAQAPDTAVEARIARLERDLLPQVRVRGRAYPPATVEEQMRRYGVPAVSVAVVDGGRIVWARAWGVADVESGRAATPATLFQAASISKPVAATAALRLVEEGRLALDEDVNARLRSWRVPASDAAAGKPVTLRQLLTHTAGVTVHGFPGYPRGKPVPTLVQVLSGQQPANTGSVMVDVEPGTRWRYSGGGTTVMQLLVTEVTGETFPELVRSRVLAPLGMASSTFEQPLPEALHGAAATAYRPGGRAVGGGWHVYPEMAAAGLWTTPSDLARWVIGVQRGLAGEPGAVLSRETAAAMLTRGMGGWGLGPQIAGEGDSLRFQHGGSNAGFRAEVVGFTAGGRGVVVMTNSDTGTPLIAEIMAAVAREYDWPGYAPRELVTVPVAPEVLREYAGRYALAGTPTVVSVEPDGESLRVTMPAGEVVEMVPVGKDTFAHAAAGSRIRFERGEDGKVKALMHGNARLERVPEGARAAPGAGDRVGATKNGRADRAGGPPSRVPARPGRQTAASSASFAVFASAFAGPMSYSPPG